MKNQAYINGKWVGEAKVDVTDPATGKLVGCVPDLGAEAATEAVEAAHEAFLSWRGKLASQRAQVLMRWHDLVMEHRDELAQIITLEQGKPLAEAKGEIGYAASFISFFAEQAKRVYGETIPSHKLDSRLMVIKQPAGVVAAITPWNFPAAMITRKVAPALAAGCTAVVKPAMQTPLTALALAALGEKAGIPKGVLNIVTGDAKAIGGVFTSHPKVRVVTFTGSTAVGKILMQQSASTVKKVSLELGGNAPFIIFDDAEIGPAVEGVIASKFRNAGQTCVCANRIYVQSSIYDDFAQKLKAEMQKLHVGNGFDKNVFVGPLIDEAGVKKVQQHIDDAVSKGAKLELGGKPHALGGSFFEPTLLLNASQNMQITEEETFGPVAALVPFDTEDEVLGFANDTEYGLAAYFYSRDIGRITRVSEGLEYGMVGVNTGIFSTELAPFGGVKESGIGREGSHHGLDEFLEMKYIMLSGLNR
jgi:succinate-semialdehyde dehydrogenase/glutarate-semialdehyde dehydrogenase